MSAVALSLPPADLARLGGEAGRYGHRVVADAAEADALAPRIAVARPDVVIASAAPPHLTARLVAACDAHGVRLVVVGDAPRERRYAAGCGVVDPVAGPAGWSLLPPGGGSPVEAEATVVPDELEFTVPRATVPPPAAEPAPDPAPAAEPEVAESVAARVTTVTVAAHGARSAPETSRGRVVAVWGPGGAPGRTSLAIALAGELAAAGVAVALADADTHGAAVAPALGLLDEAPGFAAACRLAATDAVSAAELDRVATDHRAGFRVLTGLGRPSRWPELGADRVAGVLDAVRSWAALTIVDVAAPLEEDEELLSDLAAPRRNAATLETLRRADRVVVVGAADPVGLTRLLRGHADLLEHVAPDRVTVVVNKLRSSAIGLDPAAHVRSTLERFGGIRPAHLVPWDPGAFDAALLSGRTLGQAAPRSPARAAIRRLADELAAG